MSNLESDNRRTLWRVISFPLFVLLGILGFGSPVFFSAVSDESLKDVGKGSKTLEEEMVRQLRQNNLGPAEMLLPLISSVEKREEFARTISSGMTPEIEISGGGSIFDLLAFKTYFGGLDEFNSDRKRYEAFFVYNRATVRGDLRDRLSKESSNTNVRALLEAIPLNGRPGNFWQPVLSEPKISDFSGVKIVNLEEFPYFPKRKVILSVGTLPATEMENNKSEAEIRDLCLMKARTALYNYSGGALWYEVRKNKTDSTISKLDNNQTMPKADFADLAQRLTLMRVGRTDTGDYSVIIGGVMNEEGKLESHGRWLPYPILVPMMVGTAMAMENGYYSAETSFEIGKLAQQTLLGNLEAKEKFRSFFWAAHQLARKMNLMQMSELTKSCPDLSGVFDLAAMIRTRNRPLSVSIGQIKQKARLMNFMPAAERVEAEKELNKLVENNEIVRKDFEREMKIIYAATLLSGDPSSLHRFIESYPVYEIDGDEEAAISALRDVRSAMYHGEGALLHLLEQNKPIHEDGFIKSLTAPVFPILGGGLLTYFSHQYRDLALSIKIFLIVSCFFFLLLFLSKILPRPSYLRSNSHFFLRWGRRVSVAMVWGLLSILILEPTLIQTTRGQVSVAGFDFALANLLAYANEESMGEQNLTVVTAIIAGVFLLIQVAIFMICLSRVSQVKNEELRASLKIDLLDNEENLFDLGLYVGLGGTVLSLILLLVLDVKQDALIGAYTSTLFGILFVAALKIFVVRPYRNYLLVRQSEE
ncbi:MAG: hypothetical protein CMI24_01230 [Opitutae bacterium]|nr:hypothetical protein [Opitutae bacterium]MEC8420858.1 hypothetical protein [Verrucomicrobiota bacterium]